MFGTGFMFLRELIIRERLDTMPDTVEISIIRPTKKQRELLEYISNFIAEHGYSPCYREIMRGCNYTSVATVALHVNSLIKRGHLQKRDRSARSLEVVTIEHNKPLVINNDIKASDEKWLIDLIDTNFTSVESNKNRQQSDLDKLYVLVGALHVLGLTGPEQSFMPRLRELRG